MRKAIFAPELGPERLLQILFRRPF